ncbi:MAG: preprotein translocase subunit SecA [Candidatus Colwellbacteria bacterium CG10_big_fil_rev_8_21_14_0_10_41_28]|uniref:Protein translocase subunit SecA n=1 Tax=Candidatus Colwellbacteria bacterium CG10_big_fil_rev_8_21_14_0_10_41_28 TaxID=1974539 RepID=A0A2H0VK08_9BACT|nr:MAG: preprotein translocase subunit SecA [Candidatus Colwellbacteria bacterium CG10_big_fil_rev_8_21_14_0_10_41_28]
MSLISSLKKRFSGSAKLPAEIDLINALEEEVSSLDDGALREEGLALKERAKKGESLDDLLPKAFALVRETAKRKSGQRHYDVQLWGGIVMHRTGIAQMMTGEGKTLAATAPVYLNALEGKGVHVITVNDYLAKRDAVWMGEIYDALGLSVACLVHGGAFLYDPEWKVAKEDAEEIDEERDTVGSFRVQEDYLRPIERKQAYACDITYGTNHEFGFDYLRDNLKASKASQVQGELNFALVDEVDSILIDEARTPLIISMPDEGSSEYYKVFSKAVNTLKEGEDYEVDEKLRSVDITEVGIDKIEKVTKIKDLYAAENLRLAHYLEACLKARALYKKDQDYVVKNGEVVIVDQFTGRLMYGRRYSAGLHQSIEAKENVFVNDESRTFAQITIQNYFRLYKRLSGMTGTALTSREEFDKVYGLEVEVIPTNRDLIRKDMPDQIYKTLDAKYRAIAKDVKKLHEEGRPVLIGTVSIDKNEIVSNYLKKENVPHEVLNAKNHEREGAIIAQAGSAGAVTVATNMAGRGVDIVLGGNPPDEKEAQKVKDLGGLHVIGTERHEARRIDDQLRGRAGRQGDPGSSQFFISLEDDLMRIFGGDRLKSLMDRFDLPEDVPIENKMISNAMIQAQEKVEGFNFDSRKHLLEYDDVLNKQRLAVYRERQKLLNALGEGNDKIIEERVRGAFRSQLEKLKVFEAPEERKIHVINQIGLDMQELDYEKILEKVDEKLKEFKGLTPIGRQILALIDSLWMGHLENIEALRESVRLRAYGQKDPQVEYRREGRMLYDRMQENIEGWLFSHFFRLKINEEDNKLELDTRPASALNKDRVGRNDPCPCGSGKKYKKCHGK